MEEGTVDNPFNTLTEGVNTVSDGGILHIAPGASNETFVGVAAIAKPLSLINSNPAGESVFIGQSVSRSDSRSGFVSRTNSE